MAASGRRSTSGEFLERRRTGRVNERLDDDDVDDDDGQPAATSRRPRPQLPAVGTGWPVVAVSAHVPSRKLVVQYVARQTPFRVSIASLTSGQLTTVNLAYHILTAFGRRVFDNYVKAFSIQLRPRKLSNYFAVHQPIVENNVFRFRPTTASSEFYLKLHLHLIHVARIQDVSTCIRIQVARSGYLYPATCIWCKRGFTVAAYLTYSNMRW